MATPYATVQDMRDLVWPDMPADKDADALVNLRAASIEIRGLPYKVDARILSGDLAAETVALVACRMVKRAMEESEDEYSNVDNINQQAGPFGRTITFKKRDGNIYLSMADKRLLAPYRGQAFSTMPG